MNDAGNAVAVRVTLLESRRKSHACSMIYWQKKKQEKKMFKNKFNIFKKGIC